MEETNKSIEGDTAYPGAAAEQERDEFFGDDSAVAEGASDPATSESGDGLSGDNLSEETPKFEALLAYLKRSRGFDFTGYKRASLTRRVDRRMQAIEITDYGEYIDYLEVHPDEFSHLFNMILINVTAFFRDAPMWEYIAAQVIPQILKSKSATEPIRVWSAGCASGEEAYTLAMTLFETLGKNAFRDRVKIYATDVDEGALVQARLATYNVRQLAGVPSALIERYFDRIATGDYVFHKDLRRSVIFGQHDILQDAPISRIDLLVCRNTLMYFNTETQGRALQRFHFALNPSGFLFMGKAEMLFTHNALFTAADLNKRIFVRIQNAPVKLSAAMASIGGATAGEAAGGDKRLQTRDLIFENGPVAQLMIDTSGVLTAANARARALFRLNARDIGRKFQDLEVSYRPVELRSRLEEAIAEQRMVEVREVFWLPVDALEPFYLDFHVTPLRDVMGRSLGGVVSVHDMTRYRRLKQELEEANREIETAYEELQSANEELETTNEELQSTNEELETTNAELQSTNEELETMNAELQGTNEELQTLNKETELREGDLNNANAFLSSVLAGLNGGVAVVNNDLLIRVWNSMAEEMWGLSAKEAQNKPLFSLDIGLPIQELRAPLLACLSGAAPSETLTLDAINRRGKTIRCNVSCTSLLDPAGEIIGAILLMAETTTKA